MASVTPSNLLLTTTDTRMQKPTQLASHHDVEIAWWIEPPAIQFRLQGKAYTLPPDKTEVAKALKAMGLQGDEADGKWWENKRKEVWEKEMSGHLRGSFARPAPGTPLDQIDTKPEDWPTKLDPDSVRPHRAGLRSRLTGCRTTPSRRSSSKLLCRTLPSSLSNSTLRSSSNSNLRRTAGHSGTSNPMGAGKRSRLPRRYVEARCKQVIGIRYNYSPS